MQKKGVTSRRTKKIQGEWKEDIEHVGEKLGSQFLRIPENRIHTDPKSMLNPQFSSDESYYVVFFI